MAILARANAGGNYEPIPEGTYTAICYSIIDLGMQVNEKFGNSSHKVMFTWELPDETINIDGEDKPRAISKEYTLSLGEKANLRKELEAWRGKAFTKEEMDGFDVKNVLGKPCQIQIIHKTSATGNVRANISAIMGLPKGMKLGEPTNPTLYFDMTDPKALELFDTLPEWIRTKVAASETWRALKAQDKIVNMPGTIIEEDDDLPF